MKTAVRHELLAHFEALFVAVIWVDAALLAALAGRPALGAIGVVTVLPFLVAYARRSRRVA